jgi:hypothetical protein
MCMDQFMKQCPLQDRGIRQVVAAERDCIAWRDIKVSSETFTLCASGKRLNMHASCSWEGNPASKPTGRIPGRRLNE